MPLPSTHHEWDSSIRDRVVSAVINGDVKVTTAAQHEGIPIQIAHDWMKKFKATGSTENVRTSINGPDFESRRTLHLTSSGEILPSIFAEFAEHPDL
jgi:transposase-like protein